MEYSALKQCLCARVQEKIDYINEVDDGMIEDLIDEVILQAPEVSGMTIDGKRVLRKELFDSLRRLDLLQIFMEDESITEIMINGTEHIFIERAGRLEMLDVHFESVDKLQDIIQQIVAGCNRVVNTANPIVDARLSDGSRVNIVMQPVAINGPIVTIRRFPSEPLTMEYLIRNNSITEEAAAFLKELVIAGYNIFISGGTGSGKTTFLNVLSQYIPSDERVITIEDSAELQLLDLPNLVRLETRNSNVDGCREITIRDLIKAALRMRPNRIIVGEVRGEETIDMLQCMNTGHDGSMSTGHANSSRDMLSRLENMILMGLEIPLVAVKQQIASGIDIIVHLGRLRDGSRRVVEIAEIEGMRDGEIKTNTLFLFRETDTGGTKKVEGSLWKIGELTGTQKLREAGLL